MKNGLATLVALTLMVLSQSAWADAADGSTPEKALDAYVEGLRTGSLAKLQQLFLADGQFCSLPEDAARGISCRKFSDVLGSWIAKPDPRTSGRVIDRRDATPSMSAITYELNFGGTRYIDQLLLYRIEGRWRVVAKTTSVQ